MTSCLEFMDTQTKSEIEASTANCIITSMNGGIGTSISAKELHKLLGIEVDFQSWLKRALKAISLSMAF